LVEVINRRDPEALLAAARIQQPSIDFKDRGDLMTALTIDEKTSSATKPFSITEEPDFGRIPFEPDEVVAVLLSVSNTLDPVSFADALVNECAKSEMKMSIGATNILPDDEVDDLWQDSPFHCTIDLDNLENTINELQAEVNSFEAECGATAGRARGVTPEHLSKIWSIDYETAKRTIDITSQHLKHEESNCFA